MTDWSMVSVEDLCTDVVDCINKTAPTVKYPTPWKMLRTTNVRNGWVDTRNVRYVEREVFERWIRRLQPAQGDVILTREAPLGEVGILRSADQVFLGQRLVMYRADPSKCDYRFLAYAMIGPEVQAELLSLGSGATVEHLRVPDCKTFPIRCPSLPIQRRIGAVLGTLDDLIRNNRRRIEVLEQLAQTIYREWFVRLGFPSHETTAVVDSPLGPIPHGWAVRTVAELSENVTRGIAPKYADNGEWTVLNQKCIRDRRVNLTLARRQSRNVPSVKQVRPGDVLVNSTGVGTLGRVALHLEPHSSLTVDTHVTIVRPGEASLNPWFGMCLLNHQPVFEALGAGSTGQTELSRHDIGAVQLVVPPAEIRQRFATVAWPLLEPLQTLSSCNDRLALIRDLLLPKLVTGEIDVSGLDLE